MTNVETGGGDYVGGGKREVGTAGGMYVENLTITGALIGLLMQQEARASIALFADGLIPRKRRWIAPCSTGPPTPCARRSAGVGGG